MYPFSLASHTPTWGCGWRDYSNCGGFSVKKTICCRFCRSLVPPNTTMHLFTNIAVQKNWPSHITKLLEVTVERQQQFSNYTCFTCSSKIEILERALKELQAFRVMTRCSYDRVQGLLKRVKQTSGVGVSPDTTRARPQSKLSRRRLTYCKHAVLKHLSLSLALSSFMCMPHTHTTHTPTHPPT